MLMGIDIGTSSTKAVLFDETGKVVSSAAKGYSIYSRFPGWSEQNPDVWYSATLEVINKCDGGDVSSIGFSGQMHGLVCLDKSGNVLRPAIIWADGRSSRECADINEYIKNKRLISRTMNRVSTGFLFPSLLWIFRNEPGTAKRIAHVMLPKDYVRYRLTGEMCSEPSDACSTGAFDNTDGKWLTELIENFGIPPEIFPRISASHDCAGYFNGIPVASGGGDQPMQSVGNGIVDLGRVSSNIGTAGQFCAPLEEPVFDPELRTNTFMHAVPNRWYMLGAILSAGHSLQWFWKKILDESDYVKAGELAAEAPVGSGGLLWTPWLNGDRMYNAPEAKGIFFGLSHNHDRASMVRSVMEGVIFELRFGLEIANGLNAFKAREVVASGGGARSAVWRQIQADIYNLPVVTSATEEQACLGAAIMGGVAGKVFSDVREGCRSTVKFLSEATLPNEKNVRIYDELFSIWKKVFPSNRELFSELNDFLAKNVM